MNSNWIKVSEYARKHGVSPQAVRGKVGRGTLKHRFVNVKQMEVLDEVTKAGLAENTLKDK